MFFLKQTCTQIEVRSMYILKLFGAPFRSLFPKSAMKLAQKVKEPNRGGPTSIELGTFGRSKYIHIYIYTHKHIDIYIYIWEVLSNMLGIFTPIWGRFTF